MASCRPRIAAARGPRSLTRRATPLCVIQPQVVGVAQWLEPGLWIRLSWSSIHHPPHLFLVLHMKTDQSQERLRRHYEVEKALADRLRRTESREERAKLYESMYDTLFAAVPDHPRLTLARDPPSSSA